MWTYTLSFVYIDLISKPQADVKMFGQSAMHSDYHGNNLMLEGIRYVNM